MNIRNIVVGLVFASVALPIFAGNLSQDERIATAQEEFRKVVTQTPQKDVRAITFFTNDVDLEDVLRTTSKTPLAVKGFYHGNATGGGGYSLREGETLNEATINYRRDHIFFLNKRIEMQKNMLEIEDEKQDDSFKKAVNQSIREAKQAIVDFEKNGLRIIGVELQGPAVQVQEFKDKNLFVRIIELKRNGRPQPAILPQH